MYTQYVLNYLRAGGAKIEKSNVLDIPDASVKTFISPENLINPTGKLDRVPPINRENLNKDIKLDTGAQTIKVCKLMLSNEEGNKLIQFVNNSVKDIKDRLREGIADLENHQKEIYKMYRKSVILGAAGDKMDVYSYFETVENKLKLAKSDIKKVDEEYKKNIKDLVEAYNHDKKGRHPPILEKSIFSKAKKAILGKIKPTEQIAPETESKSDTGVKGKLLLGNEDFECDVIAVHLSKGLISVAYTKMIKENKKHYDMDISFKNLCIGTDVAAPATEEVAQEGGSFENEQIYSATSEDM